MKFLSIIIAVLLVSVASIAQTSTATTTPTIAMAETAAADIFEMPGTTGDDGKLNITTDKKINSVKVIDEAGEVVISRSAQNGESVKFNLNSLKKGLYYLQIYCDGENIVRKFLKK